MNKGEKIDDTFISSIIICISFKDWDFARSPFLLAMKIKVFLKIEKEKIKCICLRENKRCKRRCEADEVEYDQYKELEELFKNKGNKNYKNV